MPRRSARSSLRRRARRRARPKTLRGRRRASRRRRRPLRRRAPAASPRRMCCRRTRCSQSTRPSRWVRTRVEHRNVPVLHFSCSISAPHCAEAPHRCQVARAGISGRPQRAVVRAGSDLQARLEFLWRQVRSGSDKSPRPPPCLRVRKRVCACGGACGERAWCSSHRHSRWPTVVRVGSSLGGIGADGTTVRGDGASGSGVGRWRCRSRRSSTL